MLLMPYAGKLLVRIHVHLADLHLAVVVAGKFVEHGGEHLAWAAPFGPKVDDHGRGGVDDFGVEVVFGKSNDVVCCHFCFSFAANLVVTGNLKRDYFGRISKRRNTMMAAAIPAPMAKTAKRMSTSSRRCPLSSASGTTLLHSHFGLGSLLGGKRDCGRCGVCGCSGRRLGSGGPLIGPGGPGLAGGAEESMVGASCESMVGISASSCSGISALEGAPGAVCGTTALTCAPPGGPLAGPPLGGRFNRTVCLAPPPPPPPAAGVGGIWSRTVCLAPPPRRQLRVWEASASERSVWRNRRLRQPEVRHLRALLAQPVPRHRRRGWAAVEVEQSVLPEPLRQRQGLQLLEVQLEPAQRQRQVWEAGSDAPFPSLKAWEAN